MKYMKYIKEYNETNDTIEIIPGSYWIIYGDIGVAKLILIKMMNMFDGYKKSEIRELFDRMNKNREVNNNSKYIGFFIYYSSYGFSYSIIIDESDITRIINKHKSAVIYDLKGEIKIENKEIVLDDTIINMNKYNL